MVRPLGDPHGHGRRSGRGRRGGRCNRDTNQPQNGPPGYCAVLPDGYTQTRPGGPPQRKQSFPMNVRPWTQQPHSSQCPLAVISSPRRFRILTMLTRSTQLIGPLSPWATDVSTKFQPVIVIKITYPFCHIISASKGLDRPIARFPVVAGPISAALRFVCSAVFPDFPTAMHTIKHLNGLDRLCVGDPAIGTPRSPSPLTIFHWH
jgi:hypothetical protein